MLDHTTGFPTKTKQNWPWIAYTTAEKTLMVAGLKKHYKVVRVRYSGKGQCYEIKCTGPR